VRDAAERLRLAENRGWTGAFDPLLEAPGEKLRREVGDHDL
jgi:hypothetical protein